MYKYNYFTLSIIMQPPHVYKITGLTNMTSASLEKLNVAKKRKKDARRR